MTLPSERRAFFTAIARLGALVILPFALIRSAKAQDLQLEPSRTGGSPELATLRQEVDALKAKVDRMDDEASTIRAPFTVVDEGKKEILSVTRNGSGRIIMTVGDPTGAHVELGMTDGGSFINCKDPSGTNRAYLVGTSDSSQVYVEDGQMSAHLGTAPDGSFSGMEILKDNKTTLKLSNEQSGGAIRTFDQDGKPIVEMAASKEVPFAIRTSAGKSFFTVNVAEDGSGQLTVGDADADRVEIGQSTGGAGTFVDLIDKGGSGHTVMTRDDTKPAFSASYNDGREFFAVGPVDAGGPAQMTVGVTDKSHVVIGSVAGEAGSFVSLHDDAGKQRANITADKSDVPLALFDAGSTQVFSVGPANGEGGPMRLILGKEDKAYAVLGAVDSDGSYLQLYDTDAKLRTVAGSDPKEGFRLFNTEDEPRFAVGEPQSGGSMRLIVGDAEKEHVFLGMVQGPDQSVLHLYDTGGKLRTSAGSDPKDGFRMFDTADAPLFAVGEPQSGGSMRLVLGEGDKQHVFLGMTDGPDQAVLHLYDPEGKVRASVDTSDEKGIVLYDAQDTAYFAVGDPKVPTVVVGDASKAHVRLGVMPSGEGATLILFDQTATSRGYIIATEKSTQLNLNDKNMRADLGTDITTEGFAGLTLGKDNKDFAIIHMNPEKGGSVLVGNTDGKFVARMGPKEGAGGQVSVGGPDGGKPLAELLGTAQGGTVYAYEKGGDPRVALTATTEKGQVWVTSSSKAGAFLEVAERGQVQITNSAGGIVVAAFENTDGLGVVRAGPKDSGVASMLGNQGVAASAILGKN